MIVAETPATIVVSQINPSPPELSTEFPHETTRAGGCVGLGLTEDVGVGVGVVVGVGVGNGESVGIGVGRAVGVSVGGTDVGVSVAVGRMVEGGIVGVMVGPAVGAPVTVGFTVAVDPLGTTRDGRGRGDDAGSDGRSIGTMAERLGLGKGVGLGWTMPTSTMLDRIPPAQVVATIATNGARKRGTQLMPPDALICAGGAGSR